MQFKKSSLKQEIKDLIRLTLGMMFVKYEEEKQYPEYSSAGTKSPFYVKLVDLIDEKKINEAENELLNNINYDNSGDLELAFLIYSYLNEKDDAFLNESNFSRSEIMFGVQNLIDKNKIKNTIMHLLVNPLFNEDFK